MRGVALHVLDVGVTLTMGQAHVGHGDVVLQIDECFATTRHFPECLKRRDVRVLEIGAELFPGARERDAEFCGDALGTRHAIASGGGETEGAGRGAAHHARAAGQSGNECGEIIAPLQRTARLGGQGGFGLVAAREQQAVRVEGGAARAIETRKLYALDRATAVHGVHDRAGVDQDAERACTGSGCRVAARVDDRRRSDTCLVQRKGGFVGPVRIDEQHGLAAHGNAVSAQVGERGTGLHHARTIVVVAGNPAFVGSRREQHAPCPDDPQSRARQSVITHLGQRFDCSEHAVTVGSDDLSAGEALHGRIARQMGQYRAAP